MHILECFISLETEIHVILQAIHENMKDTLVAYSSITAVEMDSNLKSIC